MLRPELNSGVRVVLLALPLAAGAPRVARAPKPKQVALERRVRFANLTMDSGLSHSFVRTIIQDRRGFIWIGTMDGLNRFDGYEMTVFRHDPYDPTSLGGSEVRSIFEDRDGMLWIAHGANGVSRFDPTEEKFRRYRHDPRDANSLSGDVIFNIFQDTLGRIWFSGPPEVGNLTYLDLETGDFTRVMMRTEPEPDDYQGGVVWDALEGDDGRLWLAADFLVEEMDPVTGKLTHYFPSQRERRIGSIVRDRDGQLWAGGRRGIYRLDRSSKTLVPAELAVRGVSDMVVDANGQFWVGTDSGLYVIDARVERILHYYTHDARDPATLPSQRVRHLFWSRSGLLWIGTNKGVATFHEDQNRFLNFGMPWDDETTTPWERSVSASPDGSLWVTHETGIARVDLESQTAQVFDFSSLFADGRAANEIYADSHGGVWFSRDEGVHRLDVARGELETFDLPRSAASRGPLRRGEARSGPPSDKRRVPSSSPPASVVGFAEDAEGNVWVVAVRGGLFIWSRGSDHLEPLIAPSGEASPAYPTVLHVATSAASSRDGTLWVGTQIGELIAVDPHTREVIRVLAPSEFPGMPASQVNAIHEDGAGRLWLGTLAGLLRVEPGEPSFALYGHAAGLESPAVDALLEDDSGQLWLGTRAGIVRFDPASERFRRFDTADGLPTNAMLSGAWMSEISMMGFADAGGVTLFRPRALGGAPYQAPVAITGFQLMYEAQTPRAGGVLERPIWETTAIELDHDQNVFGFEFGALDYVRPRRNRYRYWLEDFDTDWHEVDSAHRFASYTHVPPGDYQFRVEGRAVDGLWQTEGASIHVTVRRAWWMTHGARGAAVVLLLAAVYAWHRARLGIVRRQNLALERKVADRTAELEEANRKLELAATTDPLTGVPNRRHYVEKAEHELSKMRRNGRAFTIALADIDDFKNLNDEYGHDLGDRVLREVAGILRAQIREQDIVARWGGEEFILLFPETEASGAAVVAEKIRARIEASTFEARGSEARVTLTVGLAQVAKHATLEESTARADEALYEGKRRGKNCVVTAVPDPRVSLQSVEPSA